LTYSRLLVRLLLFLPFFFFHATATTEISTLSLHDALPVLMGHQLVALELAEAVGGDPGEALVRLRLLEPGARLVQVRLRLREARAGLRETRARLGEGGACLAQLLVELRRVDLGEHLAGR